MRRIAAQLLLFTALITVASCSLFEKKYLDVAPSVANLTNKESNEQIITIKTKSEWKITCSEAWVKISPKTGIGEMDVKISSSYNNTGTERKSTITVTTADKHPLTSSVAVSQPMSYLTLSDKELFFDKNGETKTVSIQSNVNWKMTSDGDSLISFSANTGTDDGTLSIKCLANPQRRIKNYVATFSYAGGFAETLNITLDQQYNEKPEKPELILPENGAVEVSRIATFKWKSSDEEGDELYSTLYYSTDNKTWDSLAPVSDFILEKAIALKSETKYYWYISVDDDHGGIVKSDVWSFTTTKEGLHDHGSYAVYQESDKAVPSTLVFVGDGFTAVSLAEKDGVYDKYMDQAIEAFFSIEPYKTYRNYFKVYKMYAESEEEGATMTKEGISKKTAFAATFTGDGTGMKCDNETLFDFVSGIEEIDVDSVLTILVVNQQKYAGTCWMWTSGRAIAICPISDLSAEKGSQTHFNSLVLHEAAGHGYSHLADEYISSANKGKTIDDDSKAKLENYQSYGWYFNVSTKSDPSAVPWAPFIGRAGYEGVNVIEGGYLFSYGVWRSESISCMINNINYYNVASRYNIVQKIFRVAGEELTFEKFLENDKRGEVAVEAAAASNMLVKSAGKKFIPLAPPVVIDNGR